MTPPGTESAAALGTANVIFWTAALLSLALLVMVGAAAQIVTSRRRDDSMRVMKAAVFILVPLLALIPGLQLAVESGGAVGAGMLFYVVLFPLFCYYFGRRIGAAEGEKHIRELVGLDDTGSIEDAQDRLFESRMRLPSRPAVIESIGRMAKEREAAQLEQERISAGRSPSGEAAPGQPQR